MSIKRMNLRGSSDGSDLETYPFCKDFHDGVMFGVRKGLYVFTRGNTIRRTEFPDARESWEVVKDFQEFRQFIAKLLELGNFDIANKWVPSVMALSYVVEALGIDSASLHSIIDSDALSCFISKLFPAVCFDFQSVREAFAWNQLPSDKPLYEYKRDKVRCGIETWGMLRFAPRHVGFQFEVAEKTYNLGFILFGEIYTEDTDGEEVLSLYDWTFFFWMRLYIIILWEAGIYFDDIAFLKAETLVVRDFSYRSPVGVVPVQRVRSRQDIDIILEERLELYRN